MVTGYSLAKTKKELFIKYLKLVGSKWSLKDGKGKFETLIQCAENESVFGVHLGTFGCQMYAKLHLG